MRSLPVAQYPSIIPPQIIVNGTFTGADAVTVEQSVATPLEQQMNGVPDVLAKLGLTVPDLVRAVSQQSTVNPAGRVGADPAPPGKEMTYTVRAQGRLQTAEEFAQIVVRSNPDGSVVRLSDVAGSSWAR